MSVFGDFGVFLAIFGDFAVFWLHLPILGVFCVFLPTLIVLGIFCDFGVFCWFWLFCGTCFFWFLVGWYNTDFVLGCVCLCLLDVCWVLVLSFLVCWFWF